MMQSERDWILQGGDRRECIARQHRIVACRMRCVKGEGESKDGAEDQMVEAEKNDCSENFGQKLRQALGGREKLPDDWVITVPVIRETCREA